MSENLRAGENYLLFEKGFMSGGKLAGLTNAEICSLCTKNYIFVVPKKDFTTYLVASRIREYNYFGEGVPPAEGLKQVVSDPNLTIPELEERMIQMLGAENNDRVIKIADLQKFKIWTGLMGQARIKYAGKLAPLVLIMKGNGGMKAVKQFYKG